MQAMEDKTYNGWKNYPTWAVNLWLSNDYGLYTEALARTREILEDQHPTSEYWTVEESRRFNVADMLKDWVEELGDIGEASMRSDLLGWAIDQTDWSEIADAWIETAQEQDQ